MTETESPVMTVSEAAALLRVSKPSLYRALRAGEIPVIKIGRRRLVPKAALSKLIEEAS
jgi:excisionase family DNA binding protein